jgi:hypothetical protein
MSSSPSTSRTPPPLLFHHQGASSSALADDLLSWFMTSIESMGAHECGEHWKHDEHEGFRQVQASVGIITLVPCSGVL